MAEEKTLVLARLRKPAGWVEFEDGTRHEVFPTRGESYQALRTAKKDQAVAAFYDAVQKCVPSATPEQVLSLDLDQVNALLGLAGSGIEAVEQLYPNAVSPAASTSPG